jgi:hypothetical protein
MNFITNLNRVPGVFQVISTYPNLKIRDRASYGISIWMKIFWYSVFVLFFIMCAYVAVKRTLVILPGLREILTLNFLQGVNTIIHDIGISENKTLIYNINNIFNEPGFAFYVFFMFPLIILLTILLCISILWWAFGITEICADRNSLTINYILLGLTYKISCLSKDIKYFNQFLPEDDDEYNWMLEVVTNLSRSHEKKYFIRQARRNQITGNTVTRMNQAIIYLYDYRDPSSIAWLGTTLADFYGIPFRSTWQSNNPTP